MRNKTNEEFGAMRRTMSAKEYECDRIVENLDREQGRNLFTTICKQCRGVLDANECLDVYQRVLVGFWTTVRKKLANGTFDSDDPIRLAFGVATRVIRNARSKAHRINRMNVFQELSDYEVAPSWSHEQTNQDLLDAVTTLTPIQRRVLEAFCTRVDETGFVRRGRYRWIADTLGLEPGTVRSVFRHGLAKVRRHMRQVTDHPLER